MVQVTVTDNTPQVLARIQQAKTQALSDGAEHILQTASRTIPLEEGVMLGSGTTAVAGDASAAGYTDVFGKLIKQHEDLSLQHDPGRQGKWLEHAGNQEAGNILQFIAGVMSL